MPDFARHTSEGPSPQQTVEFARLLLAAADPDLRTQGAAVLTSVYRNGHVALISHDEKVACLTQLERVLDERSDRSPVAAELTSVYLRDRNPDIAVHALRLVTVDRMYPSVIPAVNELVTTTVHSCLHDYGFHALARHGDADSALALVRCVPYLDGETRAKGFRALQTILARVDPVPEVEFRLIELLTHWDPEVVVGVSEALLLLQCESEQVLVRMPRAVHEALLDPNLGDEVLIDLLTLAYRLGSRAEACAPIAGEWLDDPNPRVRFAAARALSSADPCGMPPAAMEILEEELRAEDVIARGNAAAAFLDLAQQDIELRPSTIDALTESLSDSASWVRACAAEALSRVRPNEDTIARRVLGTVLEFDAEHDTPLLLMLVSAVDNLRRHEGASRCTRLLREIGQTEDEEVRTLAQQTIERLRRAA